MAKAKQAKTTQHKPTAKLQATIDDAIRKAVRARFGKPVAVEGRLGVRNTNGPSGAPYQRYILENGHTVFVSNWHVGEVRVSVSDKPGDKRSYTISRFLAAAAKREARAAKAVQS
jgi:hypothetical protein